MEAMMFVLILALGYGIPIVVVIWALKTLAQIGRDVAAIRQRLEASQQ